MDQGRIAPSPVCCNRPGGFLDKRRFTRISLRKQPTFHNQWWIQGSGPGGPPLLPLSFRPNGGPKGGKILFGNRSPSAHYLRVWTTQPPPPPLPRSLSHGLDPALPTTGFPATSGERAEKFPTLMTSY